MAANIMAANKGSCCMAMYHDQGPTSDLGVLRDVQGQYKAAHNECDVNLSTSCTVKCFVVKTHNYVFQ